MKQVIIMDIVDMARACGMTVLLDGRIGREEYQSISGSISALQRFAEAVQLGAAKQNDSAPREPSVTGLCGQLRRCSRQSHLNDVSSAAYPPANQAHTVLVARMKQQRLAHRSAVGKMARGISATVEN